MSYLEVHNQLLLDHSQHHSEYMALSHSVFVSDPCGLTCSCSQIFVMASYDLKFVFFFIILF
jgi:hypothetical protein